MNNIFEAEVSIGQNSSGQFVALHDTEKLKFWFVGETEEEVLKKANRALSLYVKYKIEPLETLRSQVVEPFHDLDIKPRVIKTPIRLDATA